MERDRQRRRLGHYAYTFTHPSGETSHLIIEASDDFGPADIWGVMRNVAGFEIGLHSPGPGQPEVPGPVYGIKFEADGLSALIEFDSGRLPKRGDFYSKDGAAGGLTPREGRPRAHAASCRADGVDLPQLRPASG